MLTSQKLCNPLGLFGLKSFHGFLILSGRIESIACLAYYLITKMWENFYKKLFQTWQTAVKPSKKHQNILREQTKIQILVHGFLGKYTLTHCF